LLELDLDCKSGSGDPLNTDPLRIRILIYLIYRWVWEQELDWEQKRELDQYGILIFEVVKYLVLTMTGYLIISYFQCTCYKRFIHVY
jgi:hypothetical protein